MQGLSEMVGGRKYSNLQEHHPVKAPEGDNTDVDSWTTTKVANWLDQLGLGGIAPKFSDNKITGDLMSMISEAHLKEMGMSNVGERLLLIREVRKVKRTAARKRRFEVIWEASEELYHDGCGDWCQKQLLCVPCCCYYPDYYKLTASTLVLTQKANRKIGSINFTKEKKVRNIDLSNMRGVSAMHAHNILSCGCDADEVFIDLDAEAGLDPVHPLYVKAGEGEKVAEIINMAMEENQAMEAMVMERD